MATIAVTPSSSGSASAAGVRAATQAVPGMTVDTTQVFPDVGGSIDSVRGEVDDAFNDMRQFHNREPDEVIRLISGHSSRLAELRGRIHRVEDFHRQWRGIRTREIEPALEELGKQFQMASRQLAVRELDWKMETGR